MVLIDYPNTPPPNSNQTPIGIPQHIQTWYPHKGIAIDNYQGIPQHITRNITPGAGPDTYAQQYGRKKMALSIDGGSILIGLVAGIVVGGIIFTATGRQFAGAAGRRIKTETSYLAGRATSAIEPKRY